MTSPHETILPVLRSRLDFSVLHAMRARRACEPAAADKLALLRRLAQSAFLESLPETRVEQSWNEQLFAKLLGYRTLLSHDVLPFNVLPKNAAGPRRFDDFSLGFFGVSEQEDQVLGTAELKSPGANLDAPQWSGNYKGLTPVQQGLDAARAHGAGCRWVLVSNFRELRLYDMRDPLAPLVVVGDMRDVRNPDDLALLCAHFDVDALLGQPGKDNAEMPIALVADHPSHPLPAQDGHVRLVLRFVPSGTMRFPLFHVEKTLRAAVDVASRDALLPMSARDVQFEAKDGWVATKSSPVARLAASRFGEIQLSMVLQWQMEPAPEGQSESLKTIGMPQLLASARAFAVVCNAFYRTSWSSATGVHGRIGGEMREVAGVTLRLDAMQEPAAPLAGICQAPEISAGDWDANPGTAASLPDPLASCLCELAIQFREARGGVGLSHQQVKTYLESRLSKI